MQIQKSRQSGDPAQIVTGGSFNRVSALSGGTFCRLGNEDYYSWLLPSLLLEADGVDSISGLETITDFEDIDSLMEAVISGECDAAGMAESAMEDLNVDTDDLTVVASTPPFPYGVLMYPINLTLGERLRLNDALLALSRDTDGRAALRPLLNQDRLVSAGLEDFEALSEFLADTGLDFAQLGR